MSEALYIFFSFITPAVLQHGHYYVASLGTPEETESERLTACKQKS